MEYDKAYLMVCVASALNSVTSLEPVPEPTASGDKTSVTFGFPHTIFPRCPLAFPCVSSCPEVSVYFSGYRQVFLAVSLKCSQIFFQISLGVRNPQSVSQDIPKGPQVFSFFPKFCQVSSGVLSLREFSSDFPRCSLVSLVLSKYPQVSLCDSIKK